MQQFTGIRLFVINSAAVLEINMLFIPRIISGRMVFIIYLYIWCRFYRTKQIFLPHFFCSDFFEIVCWFYNDGRADHVIKTEKSILAMDEKCNIMKKK